MPIKDSRLAATALAYGLSVATRNRADFEKAGVKLVRPLRQLTVQRSLVGKRKGPSP